MNIQNMIKRFDTEISNITHSGKDIIKIYHEDRVYYNSWFYLSPSVKEEINAKFGSIEGPKVIDAEQQYIKRLGKEKGSDLLRLINEDPITWSYYLCLDIVTDYKRCEYIESTGTQQINTPYNANSGITRIEHIIQFTYLYSRQLIGQNTMGGYWGITSSGNYERYISSDVRAGGKDVIILDNSAAHLTVNGVETNLAGTLDWSGTGVYQLLALTNGYRCRAKLYDFKALSNGELKGWFAPAYHKTNGIIGMFDVVTQTFYTNSGSGTFIKGPDVTP